MKWIVNTQSDLAAAVARIALGLFIFPHGAQKALGWFGGPGIEGTVGFMGSQLGIPAPLAYLAIAAEFLGAFGLVFGFLSRIAAFGVGVTLAVAAITVHWGGGFLSGSAGPGMELHFLGLALGLIVLIRGGGSASIDLALSKPTLEPVRGRPITTR